MSMVNKIFTLKTLKIKNSFYHVLQFILNVNSIAQRIHDFEIIDIFIS
jgi:hypothetical protein